MCEEEPCEGSFDDPALGEEQEAFDASGAFDDLNIPVAELGDGRALTHGQRQTGGQNLFDPADNLESEYACAALVSWFHLG